MDIVQHRDADHPGKFGCAQDGCRACLEKLLQEHEGLIHYMVRRQCPGAADYADLIQEGRIGLWLAILRYEPERGCTFSTFAGRAIRNRVWQAVRQAGKAQGWLEPQRAGDSLGAILAAWQAEQVHQALQDELACLPERLRQVLEPHHWPEPAGWLYPPGPGSASRFAHLETAHRSPELCRKPQCQPDPPGAQALPLVRLAQHRQGYPDRRYPFPGL